MNRERRQAARSEAGTGARRLTDSLTAMEPEPASLDDVDLDVFGGEQASAALDGKAARREAQLSANIKVGYRAPRGVKPHGWLGSATMMSPSEAKLAMIPAMVGFVSKDMKRNPAL